MAAEEQEQHVDNQPAEEPQVTDEPEAPAELEEGADDDDDDDDGAPGVS
jgi:hypothetical protein